MYSALTLGLFSAFNRSSLSFCSYIMSDKEGEVDPKLISGGSFDDLRAYFDQKFSHLKRELSDDQVKSSSSLVKKLKSETNLTFKFSGNKKQFEFNNETLEQITQSLSFVDSLKSLVDLENSENHQVSALILKLDDSLNSASKAIKRRNKLIRIADKSEAGWAAVDEYLSDEVASGSEDEKKIRAAEQRALKKKKNARIAKSGQKLSIFICFLFPFFMSFSVGGSYLMALLDLFLQYNNKFIIVYLLVLDV